jgi:hypothetical protein
MQPVEREEVVLRLRVRPAVGGQGWSALVEGADPEERIRFQTLEALLRYLQALSDIRPARGLR